MFESRHTTRAKIGVFAIGLAAYWPQFDGLHDRLQNYGMHVEAQLAQWGDVVSGGLVDSVEKAREAGALFAREQADIVFVYAATYATSSQVLPVILQAKVPTILLNLQPSPSLDYETITTGEWLANCSACCVPEIAMVLTRARLPYKVISGTLFEDTSAWTEIQEWCMAAKAVRHVKHARLGFLGHTYPGMLDMYSDFTAVQSQLGSHIEVLEIDDLVVRVRDASDEEVRTKIREIENTFDFAETSNDPIAAPIEHEDLEWSARVAVGLDKLASDFNLDALAYYYRGLDGNENERVVGGMIVGNTLLTSQGIPCSGEGDLKNAIAMLIMDQLGVGGSFTEFYAMDFVEQFVLMGHDGPGHIAISNQRPVLRKLKLYHGKRGFGVSVEFKVKYGPVTILGITQLADSTLKFLLAQGESIEGPTFRVGNTNSRIRFALDPATFTTRWSEEGPTHHVALGVEKVGTLIEKVGYLLAVQTKQLI
jgi:L-arabinose isomerase